MRQPTTRLTCAKTAPELKGSTTTMARCFPWADSGRRQAASPWRSPQTIAPALCVGVGTNGGDTSARKIGNWDQAMRPTEILSGSIGRDAFRGEGFGSERGVSGKIVSAPRSLSGMNAWPRREATRRRRMRIKRRASERAATDAAGGRGMRRPLARFEWPMRGVCPSPSTEGIWGDWHTSAGI